MSTSGGVLVVDELPRSSIQSTVANSGGESELYALVKAAAEGLGFYGDRFGDRLESAV